MSVVVIKSMEPIRISSTPAVVVRPSAEPPRILQMSVTRIERNDGVPNISPLQVPTLRPPNRCAWEEMGWIVRVERGCEVYEGQYRSGPRRFDGRVQIDRNKRIAAFIYNPPHEIKSHPKGPCFQQAGVGTGWFLLHWQRAPSNIDDSILYMQRILDEALNR